MVGDLVGQGAAQEQAVVGDTPNLAARLQALAEPGSVYVSEIVRDRVAGRVGVDFEDLGAHNLKNIAKPVRVFRFDEIREAHRVMETNEARGKMVVVHD